MVISLPDELLARIDRFARSRNLTRSAVLRQLAERELKADLAERKKRVRDLLANPGHHGGDSAQLVRELRDAR